MDLLQKLGGRKFILAVISIGAGIYLEIVHQGGLSVNMAGLLVGLVGAFSAANYMTTAKHFDSKTGGKGDSGDAIDGLSSQIAELTQMAKNEQGSDNVQRLVTLLTSIDGSIKQVQDTTGQVGLSVLNLNKEVQTVKRAVSQPQF